MDRKQFDHLVQEIRQSGGKVYIYGVDHLAEVALVGMYLKGIHAEAGFDRLYEKVFAGHVFGVPIRPAAEIAAIDRDSYVFVTICYDYAKVCKALQDMGFTRVYDASGFLRCYDVARFATNKDRRAYNPFVPSATVTAQNALAFNKDEEQMAYHKKRIADEADIVLHDSIKQYEHLISEYEHMLSTVLDGQPCRYMRSLLVSPGTKCNNRCIDCCADLPYFDMNTEFDVKDIGRGLERIFKTVEHLGQAVISGAEPFMHKNLPDLVKLLRSYPQIKEVHISTTGQVLPAERVIEELCSSVDLFTVSDYGDRSKNRSKFIELVKKYSSEVEIGGPLREVDVENNLFLEKDVVWTDIGDMTKRNHPAKTLREFADKCSGRKFLYLFNNKLYHCYRSAALMHLGILPERPAECLDLLDDTIDDQAFAGQLSAMIDLNKAELPPLRACDHCNSLDLSGRRVPVAIQVDHKLSPYEKTENPQIRSPEMQAYYLKEKFNL